ncbi:unnamed protein product [Caretta caretta]
MRMASFPELLWFPVLYSGALQYLPEDIFFAASWPLSYLVETVGRVRGVFLKAASGEAQGTMHSSRIVKFKHSIDTFHLYAPFATYQSLSH